jgi:uncharacterized surface anchored protein
LKGLVDVNIVSSNIVAGGVDVQCNFDYGTAGDLMPFTGALPSAFTLYNNTTDLAVTVTGANESVVTPGLYTLAYATQTLNDVIQPSIFRAATVEGVNGFEGTGATYLANGI